MRKQWTYQCRAGYQLAKAPPAPCTHAVQFHVIDPQGFRVPTCSNMEHVADAIRQSDPGSWLAPFSSAQSLPANDAARIPQPTYSDLWEAFVAGIEAGKEYPDANESDARRAADAYCKLLHLNRDPEGFEAMGS